MSSSSNQMQSENRICKVCLDSGKLRKGRI